MSDKTTCDFGAGVRLETREGGKHVLSLSGGDAGLFVLDLERVAALERAIAHLEELQRCTGLVVIGSSRGFIAGADVRMIQAVDDSGTAADMSRRGQRLFRRFERLPYRTVAAIHGACLGGGCEFALALDRRIATKDRSTKIGLPEVQLGILPAWGGTQRLPRLIGLPRALPLMLKGSQIDAVRAARLGLVDRAVQSSFLLESALQDLDREHRPRKLRVSERLLTWSAAGRSIVAKKARAQLSSGAARSFPAPARLLEVVLHGLQHGEEEGYAAEARALGELAPGKICKNLVRIFFASENARKLSKKLAPEATPIERTLVVGGGVMGAGIATLSATRGIRTRLVDLAPDALVRAVGRLEKALKKSLKRRRMKPHEATAARDRLEVSTSLSGVAGRDLVLEAVAEKLEIKRDLFATLSPKLGSDAILATNTSSIPLRELAEGLPAPERFVGLHFFNPPEVMPLVEIIRHDRVSDTTLARVASLAVKLGKVPVVVGDCPGFLVNRCLAPYLGQALRFCAMRPSSVERVDRIATDFGMPMGPLRLLDEIGIDVAEKVCGVLSDAFPDRMRSPAPLRTLSQNALLGSKSGEGFYRHGKNRCRPSDRARNLLSEHSDTGSNLPAATEVLDRMILALVLEAFRCLEEGIVDSEEALDLAMVFGIGFPAYHGGPIRWARSLGLDRVVARAQELAKGGDAAFDVPANLAALAVSEGSTPQSEDDAPDQKRGEENHDREMSHS